MWRIKAIPPLLNVFIFCFPCSGERELRRVPFKGVCAAPAVLVPESFRTVVRCPFGECAYCARISLHSAFSLAVRVPERLWEFAPSVEPGTSTVPPLSSAKLFSSILLKLSSDFPPMSRLQCVCGCASAHVRRCRNRATRAPPRAYIAFCLYLSGFRRCICFQDSWHE
jgi:hypothetical protein